MNLENKIKFNLNSKVLLNNVFCVYYHVFMYDISFSTFSDFDNHNRHLKSLFCYMSLLLFTACLPEIM